MVRTQIYLTEEERRALKTISRESGKKQSELIREAVDSLIAKFSAHQRQITLERVSGMWKDRKDLPDFIDLRSEWDRGFGQ